MWNKINPRPITLHAQYFASLKNTAYWKKSIQGESSKTLKRWAQSSRCLAQSGPCVNPLLHHMPLGRDKVGGFDLQAFHSASDSNHLIKAPFVQIRLMLQKKKRKNESLFKVGSNFFKVFWYFQLKKKKGF